MCITFFYFNRSNVQNAYRLILIANRDEFFYRKSKSADFWKDDQKIFGGKDLEAPVQSTWLAGSTNGKLGMLLNVNTDNPLRSDVQTRGVLVTNFLKQNLSACQFGDVLCMQSNLFNEFNLVLFEIKSSDIKATIQTNVNGRVNAPCELDSGKVYGISNSQREIPYKKVLYGEKKFAEIVQKYNTVEDRDILLEKVTELLRSEERHYPDTILLESKRSTMKEEYIGNISSVFVKIPEIEYGTRTHTIILVNGNDLDFHEYTMKEPINAQQPEWIHTNFEVKLQLNG